MEKLTGKKVVVFGLVVGAALGLVTWGFGALKGEVGKGYTVVYGKEGSVGSFGGVGLEITKKEGSIAVVQTLEGTPADKVGVEAGDRIVEINGEPVGDDADITDVVSKLRGEPGTEVTITVKRGDDTKTLTITRGKIEAPAPRIKIIERKGPGIEEWEPGELMPFEELPWVWGGDKKALEEYREALRSLREARRKLWQSFPRAPYFRQWRAPDFFPEMFGPEGKPEKGELRMEMDVRETDDAITIKCDMPGMKKEDIDVSLKGNVLTVKGERSVEEETKDEKGKVIRRERRFGSFSRSFTVPGEIRTEDIKTSYKDGVLTIVIPKEKAKPKEEKEIKIKIGTI